MASGAKAAADFAAAPSEPVQCTGSDVKVDCIKEPPERPDPLLRNRLILFQLLRHWSALVIISMLGASLLGVLCFFSIRASLRMCEYSVTDQQLFQPTYAIIGATTELLRCRLTLKNFAWNEHWLMFVPYGMLKELFDMMIPVITGVSMYGEKLRWNPRRKIFFTVALPVLTMFFMVMWHAGLGQPGVLRATPGGQIYFYAATLACYVEIGRLLQAMDAESRISQTWLFFIFGFSVLFPTIVYKTFMFPILARPVAATCTACSWSARLTLAQYGRSRFGNVHIVARIIIHPLICEIGMAILRNFARQVHGCRSGMAALLFVSLLVTRAMFARFLMIQVKDVGSLVLLQLCLSFLDCIPRITSKETDSAYLMMMYGSRTSEAIMATQRHNDLFVYEQQISMLCEYAALIAMPVFLLSANVTLVGDVVFDLRTLVQNCALQLMLQVLFDLLWICYDVLYHQVQHAFIWKLRDRWYLCVLAIVFMAQAYYCVYDSVLGLYCPLGNDETNLAGIRLDKCNSKATFNYQATLPQYFPLKRFPHYAPGAAEPIFNVSDYVFYTKIMNPAVCGGAEMLENCILDRWNIPVTMEGGIS